MLTVECVKNYFFLDKMHGFVFYFGRLIGEEGLGFIVHQWHLRFGSYN